MNFACEQLPEHWLTYLKPNQQRTLKPWIDAIEKHGGYIAGGFAERVAASRFFYGLSSSQSHIDTLESYLLDKHGDIDVWFPTQEKFSAVVYELAPIAVSTKTSCNQTPCTITYSIDSKQNVFRWVREIKLSLINKVYGFPQDIVESFDIHNAKCVLQNKTITYPEDFVSLLHRGYLKFRLFDNFRGIVRVGSWRHRHVGYTSIEPQSLEAVSQQLTNIVSAAVDGKLGLDLEEVMDLKSLVHLLLSDLFTLPESAYVLLSSIMPSDYSTLYKQINDALKEKGFVTRI